MDWTFNLGTVMVVALNLVAVVGAYYGLKQDNARLSSELAIAMLTERNERITGQSIIRTDLVTLIGACEMSIQDMANRLTNLESGQNEWTQSLRQRTHDLAGQLQTIVLKVDRLERPTKEDN